MTDYSFILRKMSADGQGYFSEEDRLRLLNAADRIAELEAALKPFSDAADNLPDDYVDGDIWQHPVAMHITVDDLRAARAAYLGEKNE